MAKKSVRVGVGSAFSDDRFDPALTIAEQGKLDYLVFECLAERTIARETMAKLKDGTKGYTPYLRERIETVLRACVANGTRIVSNMGAANPPAGADLIRTIAGELGLGDLPVAVVHGDEVSDLVRQHPELKLMESGDPLESILPRMASANAYLGADVIKAGLATGAPVVITGRVADPSLFLGCLYDGLGWSIDDYQRIACGTTVGHMMECGTQMSGGCFADPGKNDVPGMATIGFPFADVGADGSVVFGKVAGTGGRIDRATCSEQLIYEIHDPTRYITPDCVLDVTGVSFEEIGADQVRMTGASARPRTDTYKVVVGYHDGWIGEAEVAYAGPNALARARMSEQIVRQRLEMRGFSYPEIRVDYIGMSSLHGSPQTRAEPYEVRLRMAARSPDWKAAKAVAYEMRTLHVNGPAGGAGGTDNVREVLAVASVLVPRQWVKTEISVRGGAQ